MMDINHVIHCLQMPDPDIQMNAAAYLQHLTYQNEDTKEIVRVNNGIPALMNMLKSSYRGCQENSASVLRNLSHGNNIKIKENIFERKNLNIIESLLKRHDQNEQRLTDSLLAVVCNLSCESKFHTILGHIILPMVTDYVLIPFLPMLSNTSHAGEAYVFVDSVNFSPTHCPIVEFSTAFYRNMSCAASDVRNRIRTHEKLINCLITLINYCCDQEAYDCKIVENVTCVFRNIAFGLNELVSLDESNGVQSNKLILKSSISSDDDLLINRSGGKSSSNSLFTRSYKKRFNNGSFSLIHINSVWVHELIDALLRVCTDKQTNYDTVEAAVGAVQNLAVGNSQLAEVFRYNFRKKKGLPILVVQINSGPDRVIYGCLLALRNLGQDARNLDLIGKYCLGHLLRCLPSANNHVVTRTVIKRTKTGRRKSSEPNSTGGRMSQEEIEEYLTLDTMYHVLSLIYMVLCSKRLYCEEFLKLDGNKNCMYMLRSDSFYREHLEQSEPQQCTLAESIPPLAAACLREVWCHFRLARQLRRDGGWSSEDFCVPSTLSVLKAAKDDVACSKNGKEGQKDLKKNVYYGKPYVKARSNALLPWTYKIMQRQPTVVVSCDSEEKSEEYDSDRNNSRVLLHRTPAQPHYSHDANDFDLNQFTAAKNYSNATDTRKYQEQYSPTDNLQPPPNTWI